MSVRGLLAFAAVNVVLLNLVSLGLGAWLAEDLDPQTRAAWEHLSRRPTGLHHTADFLTGSSGDDSWRPMRLALAHLDDPEGAPLYQQLFFDRKVKFQYAPTSLVALEPLAALDRLGVPLDWSLRTISWLAVAGTAVAVALLLVGGVRARQGPLPARDAWVLGLVAGGLALAFYPLVKAFTLGQVQTWITALFAFAVLAWTAGHKRAAGILCGLVFTVKPQLGLLLVWALLRRERDFAVGCLLSAVPIGLLSLWVYGLDSHLEYLEVLSFIGRHGESYYPNQSVGGLLHRLVGNGNNLVWNASGFPPYHPTVFYGTLLTSIAIAAAALFWRGREHEGAPVIDLGIAALSFTLASPVAWEHHYGLLLPIFAVALPAALARRPGAPRPSPLLAWMLAVSFALSSNFYAFPNLFAGSGANVLQSYLLFGAALLLLVLYALRHAAHERAHSGSGAASSRSS